MERKDKLAIFQAWAESGRKWSSIMDAKAGFISAFGGALLAFLWNSLNLSQQVGWSMLFGAISSAFALLAVLSSLNVVRPRMTLKNILGKNARYAGDFKPLSFYSYVAGNFPKGADGKFINEAAALDLEGFERECLEQHFTICQVVAIKSKWVQLAAIFLGIAISFAAGAMLSVLFSC